MTAIVTYRAAVLSLILAALAETTLCAPFDWPQWQGPERAAHSKETRLLKEWPKEGPLLVWKTKVLEEAIARSPWRRGAFTG